MRRNPGGLHLHEGSFPAFVQLVKRAVLYRPGNSPGIWSMMFGKPILTHRVSVKLSVGNLEKPGEF